MSDREIAQSSSFGESRAVAEQPAFAQEQAQFQWAGFAAPPAPAVALPAAELELAAQFASMGAHWSGEQADPVPRRQLPRAAKRQVDFSYSSSIRDIQVSGKEHFRECPSRKRTSAAGGTLSNVAEHTRLWHPVVVTR